jgi:RNA polymerase sigma factor (sigma-70 family)
VQTENDPFDYKAALAACAAGDQRALQRLYQQEGARMLGVALRIVRQRALAEDIVHDACLSIWTRSASYQPELGSARGWIYSIVRNLSLNAVRNASRFHDADEATIASVDAAHSTAAWNEQLFAQENVVNVGRLQHCLQALEPERRDCLLHAYVDGCSHAEIAQRLGAPLGTVKAWIRRSLVSLRGCMV